MTEVLLPRRPLWEGRTCSPIGLGTYLAPTTDVADEDLVRTLQHGLDSGITMIDTAVNYRDQRSELVIARVLRAIDSGTRAGLTVCTKVGFVPWDSSAPRDERAWYRETVLDCGLARSDELTASGHCIAPRYISWSVERSLSNLGVDCVDLVYVHNPEAQREVVGEEEVYNRLRRAFEVLEGCVASGRIRAYGVATWNALRTPHDAPEHLSLARVVEAARMAGGDGHHLRVVQAPLSLLAPELVTARTQSMPDGRTTSALAAAIALRLRVVISAPLAGGELRSRARSALDFVRSVPGISCVLVGVRRPEQLTLLKAVLHAPPLRAPELRALLYSLSQT